MTHQYPNGRVPRIHLRAFAGGLLEPGTKADLKQLIKRAAQHGHTIKVINKWSLYRSLALQTAMRDHPAAYDVGHNPRTGGFIVQAPVGASTHGWGTAVDLTANEAGFEWLVTNSHNWRLIRTNPTGDPHHFEHI